MEKLILKLTRVNEGGEEVLCEEEMHNLAIIGECYDSDKVVEILANASIKNIAGLMAQSSKLIKAAKLAVVFERIFKAIEDKDPEQDLADQIMGGLQ